MPCATLPRGADIVLHHRHVEPVKQPFQDFFDSGARARFFLSVTSEEGL